jgi:hypothetical protein
MEEIKTVPAPKEEEKPVWMSCRAQPNPWGGNYVKVVFKRPTGMKGVGGGGAAIRYRCLTCGKTFHISY